MYDQSVLGIGDGNIIDHNLIYMVTVWISFYTVFKKKYFYLVYLLVMLSSCSFSRLKGFNCE